MFGYPEISKMEVFALVRDSGNGNPRFLAWADDARDAQRKRASMARPTEVLTILCQVVPTQTFRYGNLPE